MSLKPIKMIIILVVVVICSTAYAQPGISPPHEAAGLVQRESVQDTVAKAKEDERVPVQKDEWQFFFAPYMWVPGMTANTTFSAHTSSVSQGWYDMVPKLFSNAIGAMGRFEAWKGRWGIYVDSYFSYLEGNVNDGAGKTIDLGRKLNLTVPLTLLLNGDLKFISRAANVDFGPRYLVGTVALNDDKPLPLLSFEVLGGGRYNFYNQYLKLNLSATLTGELQTTAGGPFVNKFERSYLEPFLGMRLGLWINPKTAVLLRATVGGFGLAEANNLDCDLELDVGYKVHKNVYVYAGWRARYESFSTNDLSFDGWFNGPIVGAVFGF